MRSKIKCLMIEPEKPPVICYMKPTKKAFRKAINQGALQRGEIEAKEGSARRLRYLPQRPFFDELET